jgi:hypothetical protein
LQSLEPAPRIRKKFTLGSAQGPLKGTCTLKNPDAGRYASALKQGHLIVNFAARPRSDNSLQSLGQSPIYKKVHIGLYPRPARCTPTARYSTLLNNSLN